MHSHASGGAGAQDRNIKTANSWSDDNKYRAA
jgi:hypothetical protein